MKYMLYLIVVFMNLSIGQAQNSDFIEMDYTNETFIEKPTAQVYDAIVEHVDHWWLTSTEKTHKVGDVFRMDFKTTYKVFKIVELVENKKIVWECVDAYIDIKTIAVKDEWIGTMLIWELEKSDQGTLMKFTHKGLKPSLQCYEVCSSTWGYFLNDSSKSFVVTGKGKPF